MVKKTSLAHNILTSETDDPEEPPQSGIISIKRGNVTTANDSYDILQKEEVHQINFKDNSQEKAFKKNLKRKFLAYSEKRRLSYPSFFSAETAEQKTILEALENELQKNYYAKILLNAKHSSSETKAFCWKWFNLETNVKLKEEAVDFFEERISGEADLTFMFESFSPAIQKKYAKFYELPFDKKEKILEKMLEEKETIIAERKICQKLDNEFFAFLNKVFHKKLFNPKEYAKYKLEYNQNCLTSEAKTEALEKLNEAQDEIAAIVKSFSNLNKTLRGKYATEFLKRSQNGKETLLSELFELETATINEEKSKKENKMQKQERIKSYLLLGTILENQDLLEKALENLELALELDPNNFSIQKKILNLQTKIEEADEESTFASTTNQILKIIANVAANDTTIQDQESYIELTNRVIGVVAEAERINGGTAIKFSKQPDVQIEKSDTQKEDQINEIDEVEIDEVEIKEVMQNNKNNGPKKIHKVKIASDGTVDIEYAGEVALETILNRFGNDKEEMADKNSFVLTDGDHKLNSDSARLKAKAGENRLHRLLLGAVQRHFSGINPGKTKKTDNLRAQAFIKAQIGNRYKKTGS